MRALVAQTDGDALLATLERGRAARRNLPVGHRSQGPFAELRIPVPDRPGVIAEVASIAQGLGVNIVDIEVAHSIEGESGVLVLVVPVAGCRRVRRRPRRRRLPREPERPARERAMPERTRSCTPSELTRRAAAADRSAGALARCPGCKGISHRALLFAAIADGRSTIRGLADGADVAATAAASTPLGVQVRGRSRRR